MSLFPLTVYDNLRRVVCHCFASPSTFDEQQIADRICGDAKLSDLIRWRSVSRAFYNASQKRISKFSHIQVRVYEGLNKLYKKKTENLKAMGDDLNWHPSACILLCEMNTNTIGIAIDAKPGWKDITTLIRLLQFFRNSIEYVHMDSPIIELLLKDLNNQKITALLSLLCKSRRVGSYAAYEEHCVVPLDEPHPLRGPFFPVLKQFTVTSNPNQLNSLSRLMNYSVAVDMIFAREEIDLVCLQVILGDSWCRSKQRLFRHVNTFKKWSEANELGVKYVQQFQGECPKRRKGKL